MKQLALILLLATTQAFAQGDLPDFSFTSTENGAVGKSDLDQGEPVIIFYFDPDCDDCLAQAGSIKSEIESFDGVQLLWISWAENTVLTAFKDEYFPNNTNVYVLKDDSFMFDSYFGYSEVPAVYVYNKSWQQVGSFNDTVSIEELLSLLE